MSKMIALLLVAASLIVSIPEAAQAGYEGRWNTAAVLSGAGVAASMIAAGPVPVYRPSYVSNYQRPYQSYYGGYDCRCTTQPYLNRYTSYNSGYGYRPAGYLTPSPYYTGYNPNMYYSSSFYPVGGGLIYNLPELQRGPQVQVNYRNNVQVYQNTASRAASVNDYSYLTTRPSQTSPSSSSVSGYNYSTYRPSSSVSDYNYSTYRPSTSVGGYNYSVSRPSSSVSDYSYSTSRPSSGSSVSDYSYSTGGSSVNDYSYSTGRSGTSVNDYGYQTGQSGSVEDYSYSTN